MLDLNEMKQQWAEHDKQLAESIRLNRQVLSALNLKGARSALQRMTQGLALETAGWLAMVVALGGFIYHQSAALRFALPGIALDLYAGSMLAATIRQIVAAHGIDYGQPVAAIQKQVEAVRVLRIRITQWALLAGAVVWAPFAIVACKVLFSIDDYSQAWLAVNVLFGLSLIPLAFWVSNRFAGRMQNWPFLQRLMQDIAGQNLTAAKDFLAKLSQFANDRPDAAGPSAGLSKG
jgi:hypothetical protein